MANYTISNTTRKKYSETSSIGFTRDQMESFNKELIDVIIDATEDLNLSLFGVADIALWYPQYWEDKPEQYRPLDFKMKLEAVKNNWSFGHYIAKSYKYIGILPTCRRMNRQMYAYNPNGRVEGCLLDA